jgi:hypothetical protein
MKALSKMIHDRLEQLTGVADPAQVTDSAILAAFDNNLVE